MPLDVKPRVIDALAGLPETESAEIIKSIQAIPAAFGRPHLHGGIGIRQLRPGCYEARAGLGLRIVFSRDDRGLVVEFIGSHDAVRRYLRSL